MANYEWSSPVYRGARRFVTSDWNHADVFNETVGQVAENVEAIYEATKRIKNVTVPASGWDENGEYSIEDASVRSDSLAEVFFAAASKEAAMEAEIDGRTEAGKLVLTCVTVPEEDIVIDCVEIRNEVEVEEDAG